MTKDNKLMKQNYIFYRLAFLNNMTPIKFSIFKDPKLYIYITI